jgi:hypothetical protein
MAQHPFHDVAIVGIHNTRQARVLDDPVADWTDC